MHPHRGEVLNRYVLLGSDFSDTELMTLNDTALPRSWRRDPPPSYTAAIGDQRTIRPTSVALTVPSTSIPQQRNIVLDPADPAFEAIVESMTGEPYVFDSRLAEH